mmetsp:Transcript_20776/g.34008  ORF Transcript_20776/g.34008 Transcript_20776/m.34008 type:complete len:314 (-) Transcript_20776:40-981(-)
MVVRSSISRLLLISCFAHRNNIASPVQAFSAFKVRTFPLHQHNKMHRCCLRSTSTSTAVAATTTSLHDESGDFRILCLHGKGGNGEEFLKRLLPLRTMLDDSLADSTVSIKWEALTAPYQISDTDDAYAWWTMSPGVRSFNADEYIGFDESASNIMDALLPSDASTSATKYNYDLILGHSQGAILLSALLATNVELQRSNCTYILNGAAWPNPFKKALTSLSEQTQHEIKKGTHMLFVMGQTDNINPIESAKQVHDSYQKAGLDVSIVYHEGGHSVPNGRDPDSERALGDICDFILQAVSEKAERVDASDGGL